jgi:hypothetical protein
MRVGATVIMRNILMSSLKENQQSVSLDVSTAVQMVISEKIALGHPPSVENVIGPEETTRRLALNSGRSGQSKRKPLKRRGKTKQFERSGCSSCQSIENVIGPEETTRRLALNSGRSGQSKRKPLKRREKAKQFERSGCSSCQSIL